ncbi:MAG: Cell shape determining protein, MreB/Mrl family [Parcubacteria group bacterium GW2011_GWA2_39_18]|nr:MAG: Cell shape determining protein, MreB/Mrl family [Parcubacteria group bacterium GW2011_GWA2_39_18]
MFNNFLNIFSKDIGIDLGTANTLVYVRGKGIVINEPSVVAINKKTGQVLSVGQEAKQMVGRTPAHIIASRPLIGGVVSDFEVTEQMLKYFIQKVYSKNYPFSRPRVVIGIPSVVTEVERRAVGDAARSAGAREVYLVEEPMAAAIGARLPVNEAVGNMVVDIGGGTTDIAVISLGGIVANKSLKVAGDKMNQDIVNYCREEHHLLLGERMAEDVKIGIGCAFPLQEDLQLAVRGRDIITGLPKEIVLSSEDIREAIKGSLKSLIDAVKYVVETTPPELVADIMQNGVFMVGGGSLLRGIDRLIAREVKMPVVMVDDPLTAVARGTGLILEDIDSLRDVLINSQND